MKAKCINCNRNIKGTGKTGKCLSCLSIGRPMPIKTKLAISKINKGRKRPDISGKNNPMKRPEIRKKLSKLFKGRKMSQSWKNKIAKAIRKWLSNPKHHWNYGKKSPNQRKRMLGNQLGYKHGMGYAPYPIEFNKILKRKILKRDKYECQYCGKRGTHIHHIDYNKERCIKTNLITLCNRCNLKANFNRDYWYAYFMYLLNNFNTRRLQCKKN